MTPAEIAALFDDEEDEVAPSAAVPAQTEAVASAPPEAGSPEAIAAQFLAPEPRREPRAKPVPVEKGIDPLGLRNAFPKSIDRLQQGASDWLSSVAGDTYGRSGDPTQKDVSSPFEKSLKGLGGDLIPAAGDVAGDVIMSAGKAVLPESWQKNIGDAFSYVAESAPAQYAGEKIQEAQTNFPRASAIAGDVFNVATAATPVKKPRLDRTLANLDNQAVDAAKRRRTTETERLLRPDDNKGVTPELQDTPLKPIKAVPDERFQGQIDEVVDSTTVNPRASNTEAVSSIQSKVDDVRIDLDKELVNAAPIEAPQVSFALDKARKKIDTIPSLEGNPGKVAERIYDAFDDIVAKDMIDGQISPAKLLDARRKLDTWLKTNKPSIFSEGSDAYTIATKEIRDTLNNLVSASAPNANVGGILAQMNKLLTSRDTLFPRALDEIDTNRVSRYISNLERRTGLAPPRSPLAASANVRSPAAAGVAGTLAGGLALKDAAVGLTGKTARQAQRELADLVRKGATAPQKAALLSLTGEEEEEQY